MAMRKLPDRDQVRQLLGYDPTTGVFVWRARPLEYFVSESHGVRWNTRYAGHETGLSRTATHQYLTISGQPYYAHRIAWLLVHGEPVPEQIDHIDRNPANNRIANLRAATHSQNVVNRGPMKTNRLGVKGVRFKPDRSKFTAQIKMNGKHKHLGGFATIEEAEAAYRDAAIAYYGAFATHQP